MSRSADPPPLVPSILDRLIDEEPQNSREAPRTYQQTLRDLKGQVCRDLEDLLNTRRTRPAASDVEGLLTKSLLNYGIPDLGASAGGAGSQRETLRRIIEDAIIAFEPRFRRVRVRLLENSDPADRVLRLRIDATLAVTAAPETVVFETHLEPTSGNFAVKKDAS